MKLATLCSYLTPMLGVETSDLTELVRALKDGSVHFDELSDAYQSKVQEETEAVLSSFMKGEATPRSFLAGKPGRGGGVEADPFRAAFFLVALMINGPRKDAATNAWSVWHIETEGSVTSGWVGQDIFKLVPCPLTGEVLFGEAFRSILSDDDLARRVNRILISTNMTAEIWYDDGEVSRFKDPHAKPLRLYRTAVLDYYVITAVAGLINRGA